MANERAAKIVEIARKINLISSNIPIENAAQERNERILNWIENVGNPETEPSNSYD